MRYLIVAIALLVLAAADERQNATTGNDTTIGSNRVGWVSSPPTRSTMDIIWACFSVLLVCTYKCVHLDLPTAEENNAGWHKVRGIAYWPERPLLRKFFRQLKYMALILVAPEVGVGLASHELVKAKASIRKCGSKKGLNITHGFFANMGGFVALSTSQCPTSDPEEPLKTQRERCASLRLKRLTLEEYVEVLESLGNYEELLASENSIHDRSKSDIFTKSFAIIQSLWLVAQCISRTATGLPNTELELATIAYVLCAIIMYAIWWNKPFGAEEPIYVPVREGSRFHTHSKQDPEQYKDLLNELTQGGKEGSDIAMIIMATVTVFSAVHLVAWNWQFPSSLCANLWRAFSTGATACGPVAIFFSLSALVPALEKHGNFFFQYFSIAIILLYVICRIGLMVLVFYSFKSMPAAVYTTIQWSSYLPHIG